MAESIPISADRDRFCSCGTLVTQADTETMIHAEDAMLSKRHLQFMFLEYNPVIMHAHVSGLLEYNPVIMHSHVFGLLEYNPVIIHAHVSGLLEYNPVIIHAHVSGHVVT